MHYAVGYYGCAIFIKNFFIKKNYVLQFIIVFLIDSKLLGIIFTKQKSGPNPFSGTEM